MNELDIMKHAKSYLDSLSYGINPLDGIKTPPDDIVNNVRISRCLRYVSDILQKVIDNGGITPKNSDKPIPFSITEEKLEQFRYSDNPIPASEITNRINSLIDLTTMKKLKNTAISEYLVDINILEIEETSDGKKRKIPTQEGYNIGLTLEKRISQSGFPYTVNMYSKNAQMFIIENIAGIIEKNNTKKTKDQ